VVAAINKAEVLCRPGAAEPILHQLREKVEAIAKQNLH
jgi:hypothetical protein